MLPGQFEEPDTREFVLAHLHELPRREGLRRATYLTQMGGTVIGTPDGRNIVEVESTFYRCDLFDEATHRTHVRRSRGGAPTSVTSARHRNQCRSSCSRRGAPSRVRSGTT